MVCQDVELFGAHNFGATFRVPGFVTIGPDFRIIGSLAGEAQLKINATYEMEMPGWDYSMRYPIPDGEDDKPDEETTKMFLDPVSMTNLLGTWMPRARSLHTLSQK